MAYSKWKDNYKHPDLPVPPFTHSVPRFFKKTVIIFKIPWSALMVLLLPSHILILSVILVSNLVECSQHHTLDTVISTDCNSFINWIPKSSWHASSPPSAVNTSKFWLHWDLKKSRELVSLLLSLSPLMKLFLPLLSFSWKFWPHHTVCGILVPPTRDGAHTLCSGKLRSLSSSATREVLPLLGLDSIVCH